MYKLITLTLVIFLGFSNLAYSGWGDFIKEIPGVDKIPLPKPEPKETKESTKPTSDDRKSPLEELAKKDIKQASTIGSAIGGGAAIIAARAACKKKPQLCNVPILRDYATAWLIKQGSDFGGKYGKQIGKKSANRRRHYGTESAFLKSEINASEKAISVRQKNINNNRKQIKNSQKQIAKLENKKTLTEKDIKAAKAIQRQYKENIETNKITIAHYNEKIAYLDSSLKDSEKNMKEKNDNKDAWKVQYNSLKAKRDELSTQRKTLQGFNSEMSEGQKSIAKMIS